MDQLSNADAAAMERMLSRAGSAEERAYLMKALAAGHGVKEIETFQGKINGKDPERPRRHLTPVVTAEDSMDDEGLAEDGSNNNKDSVLFHDQAWIQGGDGSEGTCVGLLHRQRRPRQPDLRPRPHRRPQRAGGRPPGVPGAAGRRAAPAARGGRRRRRLDRHGAGGPGTHRRLHPRQRHR
ncbi:hypothetical protein SGLAM104S_00816 [Streptomyces glaucescens]